MAVTFDRINKIIEVEAPATEITIQELYNAICDYQDQQVNMDMPTIASASGKEALGGGVLVGITVKLMDGWRVRFESRLVETICNVNGGNLVAVDELGADIFPLAYSSFVLATLTSSSSATLQELSAIQYSSFNDGVTIDEINGSSGTEFPYGTPMQPVDNLIDAVTIATANGFKNFYFVGDFTFTATTYIIGYNLIGQGFQRSTFTFDSGSVVAYCSASDAKCTGTVLGITGLRDCHIKDYAGSNAIPSSQDIVIEKCLVEGTMSIPASYTGNMSVLDCWSGSFVEDPPTLDMNGANAAVIIRNYNGGIKLINYTQSNFFKVDLNSGRIELDPTVTNGEITIRGVGLLEDNSTALANVNSIGLMSKINISEAVWDEPLTVHNVSGSSSVATQYASFEGCVSLDVNNGTAGTDYPIGTPTNPVNNLADAKSIAVFRGFNTIKMLSDLTIADGEIIDELTIKSENWLSLTLESNVSSTNASFETVSLYGELSGTWNVLVNCWVYDITNFAGWLISGSYVNIALAPYNAESLGQSFIDNTTPMFPNESSIVTMSNDTSIAFTSLNGDYEIKSMISGCAVDIELNAGTMTLDSSCIGGMVVIRGVGELMNNSSGTVIDDEGLMSRATVSSAVWDEPLASHVDDATTGYAMLQESYNGTVFIDAVSGTSGTEYPYGIRQHAVNNLADALTITNAYGLTYIHIIGALTISGGENLNGLTFKSDRSVGNTLIINNATTANTYFQDLSISGSLNGRTRFTTCATGAITGFDGGMKNCLITGDIVLTGSNLNYMTDCDTFVTTPGVYRKITLGSSPFNMIRGHGNYEFSDKTGSDMTYVGITAGDVKIDSNCVTGTITLVGAGKIIDESGAGCTVDTSGTVNQDTIVSAIMTSDMDDGISTKTGLQAMLSAIGTEASGGGTANIAFRNANNTSDRMTMVVDENGNRSDVTINPD